MILPINIQNNTNKSHRYKTNTNNPAFSSLIKVGIISEDEISLIVKEAKISYKNVGEAFLGFVNKRLFEKLYRELDNVGKIMQDCYPRNDFLVVFKPEDKRTMGLSCIAVEYADSCFFEVDMPKNLKSLKNFEKYIMPYIHHGAEQLGIERF